MEAAWRKQEPILGRGPCVQSFHSKLSKGNGIVGFTLWKDMLGPVEEG